MNKEESIVITIGDPAGCGPLVTLKAIKELADLRINFLVVADKIVLERYPIFKEIENRIQFFDLATKNINKIQIGQESKESGLASIAYLDKALDIMAKQKIKRLVTAPISKEAVGLNIPNFLGHTEYLASYFSRKEVIMMMVGLGLRIVLLTRHIPLRDVSKELCSKDYSSVLIYICNCLKTVFNIKEPKIAIAAFNPHASEKTFLDKEEESLRACIKKNNLPILGPFPADTIFTKNNLSRYDCVIALYHDQGMIPFKLLAMKEGVNVTLGLPIVRTSPAHGVAYDIMAKGQDPMASSMASAIKLALNLEVDENYVGKA